MRLKELEGYLQQVNGFDHPKIDLEQYVTSGHIASHMIYTMDKTYEDINGKVIADFGCGCGVLSIGCCMVDAGQVFSFDVDQDALDIAYENTNDYELDSSVSLINCDIVKDNVLMNYFKQRKIVDTVIMNPPFGTKNNKGIDMLFLFNAVTVAQVSVYSLHKTSTRDHIKKKANEWNCEFEVVAELRYDLPKTYRFHKKASLDVEVDFVRLVPNR